MPEILIDPVEELVLLEVAEQGPPGPPGAPGSPDAAPAYKHKGFDYTGGKLVEVRLYSDVAGLTLAARRVLGYVDNRLDHIDFYDGAGALLRTRQLNYTGAELTSVVDT